MAVIEIHKTIKNYEGIDADTVAKLEGIDELRGRVETLEAQLEEMDNLVKKLDVEVKKKSKNWML